MSRLTGILGVEFLLDLMRFSLATKVICASRHTCYVLKVIPHNSISTDFWH